MSVWFMFDSEIRISH